MFCPHCGTETPLPATACQACRTPFSGTPVLPTDSETITYGTGRRTGTWNASATDGLAATAC